jgi:hypothetical protein
MRQSQYSNQVQQRPLTAASRHDCGHAELAGKTAKHPAAPLIRDEDVLRSLQLQQMGDETSEQEPVLTGVLEETVRDPQVTTPALGCKPICKPDAAGQAETGQTQKISEDIAAPVVRGQMR